MDTSKAPVAKREPQNEFATVSPTIVAIGLRRITGTKNGAGTPSLSKMREPNRTEATPPICA
ncbi:unnamed protein product [Ectocarpus sp. CCAP 1310/34]|nr:unnamed protein product [Ectocarpus sp. CCAP 1310/34]